MHYFGGAFVKKTIFFLYFELILLLVFISELSLAGYLPMTHRYGDVNYDGEINSIDVIFVRRHILEILGLTDEYSFIASDINADYQVDILDYSLIKREVLGMIRIGGGTFYGTDGSGGNCSCKAAIPVIDNDNPLHEIYLVAAMNIHDYDNSNMCGACVEATGPDGTVRVIITDKLPEGNPGDIDFSESCYHLIADPTEGRVPIYWEIVAADVEGPVVYHFSPGSNPYWTAVQVRNHRYPIAKFEYLVDTGEFKEVPRSDHNYFVEAGGMGAGPYTFRVTDMYGQVIIDIGIEHVENGDFSGSEQFPLLEDNN